MKKIFFLLFLFCNLAFADQFEDIPGKLEMGAGQTVRRNLSDTAFEAVAFPTPLPTSTPQTFPTALPTATPQSFPTPLPTATPQATIQLPISLTNGGTELSNAITIVTSTGNINNLALASSVFKFAGSFSGQTLTGIVSSAKAHRVLLINLNTSGTLQLNHESGLSTAANRFSLPDNAAYLVPYNAGIEVVYDTNSSRWRLAGEPLKVVGPIFKSGATIYITQATSGSSGYISSSDFTTFLDNWKQLGNDIYSNVSNNVIIASYPCAALTTYATCAAKVASGCSLSLSGNCSIYDGNESGCSNAEGGQCSWSSGDNTCSGSYFQSGDCSGNYISDDGTNAKLQAKATIQCSGSSNACSTYNSDSGQCSTQGCSYTSNTCSSYYDEYECNNNSPCSWTNNPQDCSVYNDDMMTCGWTSGCSTNDCSSYSSDEYTCTSANASCYWAGEDCSAYSNDYSTCTYTSGCSYGASNDCNSYDNTDESTCLAESGCAWDGMSDCYGTCSGSFNATCSGDWCSGSYDSYSCGGDNGGCFGSPYSCASRDSSAACTSVLPCAWTTTPAGRFQGDLITTSATGTNKVVCIKSNGAFGVCSASVSGSTCSCS